MTGKAQPSFTNIGLPPSAFATGLAPQKLAALAIEELQTTYRFTDIDLAQFLVNTECLEATFDSFAAWGVGMNPNIFGQGPAPLGNPTKANLSPEIQPWVEEVAHNEIGHVRILKEFLGPDSVPCPQVEIRGAFEALFNLAFGTTGVAWNPYQDDIHFVLSMYALEEIGATGDQGVTGISATNGNLTATALFGGLAGSAWAQSAADRYILWERRNETVPEFNVTVAEAFARISALRDTFDGAIKIDQPLLYLGGINIVPTDGNGVTLARTPQQVLNILTLGSGTGKGGFFPNGVNGRINTPVPLDPSAPASLINNANLPPVIVPQGQETSVNPFALPPAAQPDATPAP